MAKDDIFDKVLARDDHSVRRFAALEVDDDPTEGRRRAAEREAAARREVQEAEEAGQRLSAAEARRRAAEIERLAAEEESRASSVRRDTAAAKRAAKREREAASRAKAQARDVANDAIHTYTVNNYFPDRGNAIEELLRICREAGFRVGPLRGVSGNEGRTAVDLSLDGDDRMLVITWYKMASGRWEIVAYVS